MCGIYGAFGRDIRESVLRDIREATRDRGRDGHGEQVYALRGASAVLGSNRGAPTPEPRRVEAQPYGGVIHNGTIANDRELGNPAGEVDSAVLPRVLRLDSLRAFADSLSALRGSYALAAIGGDASTVYLAANYKPLSYVSPDGGLTVYFASMARHLVSATPPYAAPVPLTPYSALDLATGEHIALPVRDGKRVVVVASAGLDSTTAAAMLTAEGYEVRLLHFTYGCRAEGREAERIPRIAEALGATYEVLPLDYSAMKGASPLLNRAADLAVGAAGAEYAHEWVPARNLVMIAHATAYAEANGFHAVALGLNLEEGGAYPDNEERFVEAVDAALPYATQNGYRVRLLAPLARMMKAEIVRAGLAVRAPYALTWSCYRDGARPCGACGPCFMRRAAFARCGARDEAL